MNASSVVYLKAANTDTDTETAPAKAVAPRRWFARRSRQPTTFQRCLALHLMGAERYGALD
jgi:hypothetical protein